MKQQFKQKQLIQTRYKPILPCYNPQHSSSPSGMRAKGKGNNFLFMIPDIDKFRKLTVKAYQQNTQVSSTFKEGNAL